MLLLERGCERIPKLRLKHHPEESAPQQRAKRTRSGDAGCRLAGPLGSRLPPCCPGQPPHPPSKLRLSGGSVTPSCGTREDLTSSLSRFKHVAASCRQNLLHWSQTTSHCRPETEGPVRPWLRVLQLNPQAGDGDTELLGHHAPTETSHRGAVLVWPTLAAPSALGRDLH